MGKQAKIVYTDDLTGNEIPESEVVESTLRLDGDEWNLVLTEDSFKELRVSLERFTASAMHVQRKLARVKAATVSLQAPSAPDQAGEEPTEPASPEPDNATIRTWWRGLRKADLRTLGIPAPPPSNRGTIPAAVREAHRTSTQRIPVDA